MNRRGKFLDYLMRQNPVRRASPAIIKLEKVCPGGRRAWYRSTAGLIRKERK